MKTAELTAANRNKVYKAWMRATDAGAQPTMVGLAEQSGLTQNCVRKYLRAMGIEFVESRIADLSEAEVERRKAAIRHHKMMNPQLEGVDEDTLCLILPDEKKEEPVCV